MKHHPARLISRVCHIGPLWRASGSCPGITRALPGRYTGTTRALPGRYPGVTRALPARHPRDIRAGCGTGCLYDRRFGHRQDGGTLGTGEDKVEKVDFSVAVGRNVPKMCQMCQTTASNQPKAIQMPRRTMESIDIAR